jgi:hypothetical protein
MRAWDSNVERARAGLVKGWWPTYAQNCSVQVTANANLSLCRIHEIGGVRRARARARVRDQSSKSTGLRAREYHKPYPEVAGSNRMTSCQLVSSPQLRMSKSEGVFRFKGQTAMLGER